MHEAQLARNILDAVLARAQEAHATRVLAVRGWLADAERLDPRSLAFHFAAHARGTIAEQARLGIELRRLRARCRTCQVAFDSDGHVPVCPRCDMPDCEWLGTPGLGIEELEVS